MAQRGRKPKPSSLEPHQAFSQDVPAAVEVSNGCVTLWGATVRDQATHLTFAIHNDETAKALGLCGEHVFAKRQIFKQGGPIDGLEFITVSYALANLKAQSSQPCD